MKNTSKNIIFSLFVIAVSFLFLFEKKLKYPSNVFPYAIITIALITSTILLINSVKAIILEKHMSEKDQELLEPTLEEISEKRNENKRIGVIVLTSIVYLVAIPLIGFYLSSVLNIIFLSNYFQNNESSKMRRILKSIVVSGIVVAFVYILFDYFLNVPAPVGIIFKSF